MSNFNSKSVLVVEDSEEDWEALQRALRNSPMMNIIVRCEDGEEALATVNQLVAQQHYPVFILLDLNLPGTDGKTVLKMLKSKETLKKIPVVVFTTSTDERDINECYLLGAESYMVKPMVFGELKEKIITLEQYWMNESSLPAYI